MYYRLTGINGFILLTTAPNRSQQNAAVYISMHAGERFSTLAR